MRLVVLSVCVLVAGCDLSPTPASERCLQPPPRSGEAVATVGSIPITVDEIHRLLREQASSVQRRVRDAGELKQFVEDQIRLELLAQAALERGLDKDPEVVTAARKIMVRKLLERDLQNSLSDEENKAVSEQAIVNYYERNRDKYQQPEVRRVAHILLGPDEKGQALAASLIAQLSSKLQDKALWKQLASRYSMVSDTKQRGAELPYATHQELAREYGLSFANQAFGLAPGQMFDGPVQSIQGWHVLRVVAVRDQLTRPLEEVRDEIKEKLMRDVRSKAFDRYLAELRTRYPVALYDDRVHTLAAALAEQGAKEAAP